MCFWILEGKYRRTDNFESEDGLQKWADERGYQVIDFFEDSAVSGKIPAVKRKAFQES